MGYSGGWQGSFNLGRTRVPFRSLLACGFGFSLHLRKLIVQSVQCRLERGYLGACGGEIAPGSGDFFLGLARKLGQCLLKKFDIGLQTSGAPLHLLFGSAYFESADVLCRGGRQQRQKRESRDT